MGGNEQWIAALLIFVLQLLLKALVGRALSTRSLFEAIAEAPIDATFVALALYVAACLFGRITNTAEIVITILGFVVVLIGITLLSRYYRYTQIGRLILGDVLIFFALSLVATGSLLLVIREGA